MASISSVIIDSVNIDINQINFNDEWRKCYVVVLNLYRRNSTTPTHHSSFIMLKIILEFFRANPQSM